MSPQNVIQITPLKDVIRKKPSLYDKVVIDLSVARNEFEISVTGDFFYVFSGPAVMDLNIRFNEVNKDQLPIVKGDTVTVPFYRFFLTNSAQAGQTAILLIGKDLGFAFRQLAIETIYEIQQPVKQQAANNWRLPDAPINIDNTVGGKLIVPANAARQSVSVNVEGASPVAAGKQGLLFAGGAGAGRIIIPAGGWYTFYHTGAIYGICGPGLNSNVTYEEEYNS